MSNRVFSVSKAAVLAAVVVFTFAKIGLSDDAFDRLIADKKYSDAIAYADDKIPFSARTADVLVKLATASEELGFVEKALAFYMVSCRMNPTDYASLYGTARVYGKLGQPDNALIYAKKALDAGFTAEASWEYARACIALNRAPEAKKALEKVIETDPANALANRELGIIYYNEKSYDKALVLLKNADAKKAEADLELKIGNTYLELGTLDSAIIYLKMAVAKAPVPEASLSLARVYFGKEKFADAADAYNKVVGRLTLTSDDYYKRAVATEKSGSAEDAYKAYQAAVAQFGSARSVNALTARAKVAAASLQKKNFVEAASHFEFLLGSDNATTIAPDIYLQLCDSYEGQKKIESAIAILEKAIARDKNDIKASARLADLYQKNGMAEKARLVYEKMIALNPNDPRIFMELGRYNLKAGKHAEALGYFEKSYLLQKDELASEGIALSAFALGKFDKARDAAESAVSDNGALWQAREVLVAVLIKDKIFADAKRHLEILAARDGANLNYQKQLSLCYEQTGAAAKGAETDKKICELDKKDVDSRLRLAKYSLANGDAKTALVLYKELSVLAPQNADVFKNLYTLSLSGDRLFGLAALKRYLEINPGDPLAQRDLGDQLYERKDLDGSLAAYRMAIKLDPSIKGFYKRYAEIVIAKGQTEEVIKALSGVIKQGEADVATYSTLGMIYQKNGKYPEALDMYQKGLQIEPQNTDILFAMAETQAKMGTVNDAIITYEQGVMMNPKAGKEYQALGDLYVKQNKPDQAMRSYRKYLEAVPSDGIIALKVGMGAFEKKQYEDAIKYLGMIPDKNAMENSTLFTLSMACYLAGNYKKAIENFEQLRSRKNAAAYSMRLLKPLGESYERDNDAVRAIGVYSEYIKTKGVNDPDVAYKVASMVEKTSPAQAVALYEKNVAAYPRDYRNFLAVGLLYAKNKETLAKSVGMLSKTAQMADTIAVVWLELGRAYGKLGKEKEELEAYKRLLKFDPQNLDANKRLGIIMIKQGSTNEGLIYLEMAKTLQPKDPEILSSLASGYKKTNRLQEAADLLAKAKELKPDDIEIRTSLYDLYMKTGQKKKAGEEIKQLATMQKDPKVLLLFAEALFTDEKFKEAQEVIEDVKATISDNAVMLDALMLQARIKRAEKKYEEAVDVYKEISYIDANFVPALQERAETYMQMSKPMWAETFYKRALQANPKYAFAQIGMAKIAKSKKNDALCNELLEKAILMDPNNKAVLDEVKKVRGK